MEKHVIDILNRKEHPLQVGELLTRCKELVKLSRDDMSQYYDGWDIADATYRGERRLDEQDKKAADRGEPVKVVVPLSKSQIQTFVSVISYMFTQRDYMFELGGAGVEDVKPAKLCQAVMERDLNYNCFKGILLTQWATDIGRYGIGVLKTDWTRKTIPQLVMVPDPKYQPQEGMAAQMEPPMVKQYQDVTQYLGNRMRVISPYRFFPDTRLPLTRYREGEFCADENDYSIADLRDLATAGTVAGIDDIPMFTMDALANRRSPIFTRDYIGRQMLGAPRYALVTEVQIRLNPAKTKLDNNTVLNPDIDRELLHWVWYANDGRIIRIEECGYDHEEFVHDMVQFFNDQQRLLNGGLADDLKGMQEIMDWLMNSRVANVKKVIYNQLVVHPSYVEFSDLQDRNPVIRLKPSATPGLAVQAYIQQLAVNDVTTGHLADMQNVSQFAKQSTGISENLVGQYTSGRRSARQTSDVNAAAATRIQVVARALWEGGIYQVGRKMVSNIRQGLDEDQLIRIVGLRKFIENSQPDPTTGQSPIQDFLPVNKTQLIGNYDILVFDATLPSQRLATAAALQELLVALSKDWRLIFVFNKDPKLLLDEVLELRNVRNSERFDLTPQRAQQLLAMAGAANNPGGPAAPGAGGGGQPPTGGGSSQPTQPATR